MPFISQTEKARVEKLVKILAKCSSPDATIAADKICRDPEAIDLLTKACGFSVATTAMGIKTASANLATWPIAVTAAVLAGAGALGAKRFCTAVVNQTGNVISTSHKQMLR